MAIAYKNEELRLVQIRPVYSAADAVSLVSPAVPQGRIWAILAAAYFPSAAETRTITFEKVTISGAGLTIYNPTTLALSPTGASATPLENGTEINLLPGESLRVRRDVATAGSSMTLTIQLVEYDLPLYTYDEPQIVKRQGRAMSSLRSRMAGGIGRGGGEAPGGPGGGGRGRPFPV